MKELNSNELAEVMKRPWNPRVEPAGEGFRLSIPEVSDFEVYAETAPELWAEWRDLLESHLGAYLRIGKHIPQPSWFTIVDDVPTANSSAALAQFFALSESFVVRANEAPVPEGEEQVAA